MAPLDLTRSPVGTGLTEGRTGQAGTSRRASSLWTSFTRGAQRCSTKGERLGLNSEKMAEPRLHRLSSRQVAPRDDRLADALIQTSNGSGGYERKS